MAGLREASREAAQLQNQRTQKLANFIVVAKFCAPGGALLAVVGKLIPDPFGTVFVVIAATIAFAAAIMLLIGDDNAASVLGNARIALDAALDAEEDFRVQKQIWEDEDHAYRDEIRRLGHLQSAREIARQIFETVAIQEGPLDELSVIDRMLQQARYPLISAHAFERGDHYTICIYKTVAGPGGSPVLQCVANIREINCPMDEARKWPIGVGVAGTALARHEEVIVPDLQDEGLGTLLEIPIGKPEDRADYRSIAAVPIWADHGREGPWGVVCATSNVPGHFNPEERDYVNVTKTLAGMTSLAVKLVRGKQSTAQSVPGN